MFSVQNLPEHLLLTNNLSSSRSELENQFTKRGVDPSPTSIPLRLEFKPSDRRKTHQLNKMGRSRLQEHQLLHRRAQSLPEYLHLASNDNLYPSTASVEHIAPLANDGPNADLEGNYTQLPVDQDPNSRPSCFRNMIEEIVFIFTVMMATASTTFIQGVIVINTALIGKDLRMTESQITWISAAVGYVICLQPDSQTNVSTDLQVDPSCCFSGRLQTFLVANLNSAMAWLFLVSSLSLPSGHQTHYP